MLDCNDSKRDWVLPALLPSSLNMALNRLTYPWLMATPSSSTRAPVPICMKSCTFNEQP